MDGIGGMTAGVKRWRWGALVAFLALALLAIRGYLGGNSARLAGALVGRWEPEDVAGKVAEYFPDGTGRNANGSRFEWSTGDGVLIAKAVSPEGVTGEPVEMPIELTRDGKEYRVSIGGRKVVFLKVADDGRRHQGRSEADRSYEADRSLED